MELRWFRKDSGGWRWAEEGKMGSRDKILGIEISLGVMSEVRILLPYRIKVKNA